jgi:hypothetical protein
MGKMIITLPIGEPAFTLTSTEYCAAHLLDIDYAGSQYSSIEALLNVLVSEYQAVRVKSYRISLEVLVSGGNASQAIVTLWRVYSNGVLSAPYTMSTSGQPVYAVIEGIITGNSCKGVGEMLAIKIPKRTDEGYTSRLGCNYKVPEKLLGKLFADDEDRSAPGHKTYHVIGVHCGDAVFGASCNLSIKGILQLNLEFKDFRNQPITLDDLLAGVE